MTPINKILAAVKFSERSYRAADVALAIARGLRATLVLIHVHMRESAMQETIEIPAEDLDKVSEDAFRRLLDELVGDATPRSLESIVEHSVSRFEKVPNSPAEVVTKYAKSNGVSMIVIGSGAHSRVGDVILGNVGRDIVRGAECPVTVVH